MTDVAAQERFAWTDARVELLRKLWEDGFSCSQIAADIGHGATRNGVIGKANRLGLSGRVSFGRRPGVAKVETPAWVPDRLRVEFQRRAIKDGEESAASWARQAKASGEASVARATPPQRMPPLKVTPPPSKPLRLPGMHAFDPGEHRTVSILALRSDMCRWPYGETRVRYCGDPTADPGNPKCPYCAMHTEIARGKRSAESEAA